MMGTRDYRLALILPESRELLATGENGRTELPRFSVPGGQRSVEQLNRLAAERWQIRTIVIDIIRGDSTTSDCAFMEVRGPLPVGKGIALWPVATEEISDESMSDAERASLSVLFENAASAQHPFAQMGWVEKVQRWIQNNVSAREVSFTGDVLQLNAGGGFELCRLATHEGPAYWVKAVGRPNLHEFPITRALGKHLPLHLPPIVAMREDWNAWAMEEAGPPLAESFTLPEVLRAVVALAELQRDSIDHLAALAKAGCSDCSIPAIESHLSEITEYLEGAMARQISTKVTPLDRSRLRELEGILREACLRMQDLGIPDTLIHNDINAGNILVSDSRCLFIDWAEAQIGNPFFTFQHICAQITREVADANAWLPEVKRAYRRAWSDCLNQKQITQAHVLMPLLAIASYLYGRGDWLSSPHRDEPTFGGYLRSLARHMDRAARASDHEGALCY